LPQPYDVSVTGFDGLGTDQFGVEVQFQDAELLVEQFVVHLPHVFEDRADVDATEARTVRLGDRHPDHIRQPIVDVGLGGTDGADGAAAGVVALEFGRRMDVLVILRVELLLPLFVVGGSEPPLVVRRGVVDHTPDRPKDAVGAPLFATRSRGRELKKKKRKKKGTERREAGTDSPISERGTLRNPCTPSRMIMMRRILVTWSSSSENGRPTTVLSSDVNVMVGHHRA